MATTTTKLIAAAAAFILIGGALLIICAAQQQQQEDHISYGSINQGDGVFCHGPEQCKRVKTTTVNANPYQRGCETADRCKRDPSQFNAVETTGAPAKGPSPSS